MAWPDTGERRKILWVCHMGVTKMIDAQQALDVVLDMVPEPVVVIDDNGEIVQANVPFGCVVGYEPEECRGENLYDFMAISALWSGMEVEVRLACSEVAVSGTCCRNVRPVLTHEGTVAQLVVTLPGLQVKEAERPVLENRPSAGKVQITRARLSQALQAAQAAIWQWDLKANEVAWSDEMWELLGLEETGALPSVELWASALHPETRQKAMDSLLACVDSGAELEVECELRPKDGASRWVMTRGRALHDEHGEIRYYIGTTIDISSRKILEQQLRYSKERLKYALDAARSGVWEWNLASDELLWSEQVWRLYGMEVQSEELSHQLCVNTVHPEDRGVVSDLIKTAAQECKPAVAEYRTIHPDGSVHWLQSQGMPLFDDNGQLVRYIGLISDITERKIAEQALVSNRARLGQALEASMAGVWEWEIETGENYWSDEIWSLYGLESHCSEPSFELWASTIIPEDRSMAKNRVLAAASSGSELLVEYRVRYADGSIHWLHSRGKPLKNAAGRLVRYIGTIIDITDQKVLERMLKENEERTAFALEATNAGVWEWDLRSDKVKWTERVWRLYGLEPNSLPANHKLCQSTVLPEDRETTFKTVLEAANSEIEINIEYRVCHPADGSIHWLACRGMPRLDEGGKLDRYIGTVMDITERKRLDNELRESERKFRSIFDNAPIAISIQELESGKLMDVNESWLHLLGYEKDEVLGRSVQDVGLHAGSSEYKAVEAAIRKQERIGNRPMLLTKKTGDLVDVLYSSEFIELNDKVFLLVMMVDITLEKMQQQNISHLEQSIAERNMMLQKEVERLQRFLNMISHEYRTPLAIIRTNLDLVKMKHKMGIFTHKEEFIKVERAIARLVEVLEESIQESRISEVNRRSTRQSFSLAEVVDSQVDAFSGIWKERTITYEPCPEEFMIYGEQSEIKFAVFNLLDNARKYSPDGSLIELTCFVTDDEYAIVISNEVMIELGGHDLEMCFEKYHRGQNSVNTAGAGLGLWLVRNIVQQHGGTVTLSKADGKISATARLPRSCPEVPKRPEINNF